MGKCGENSAAKEIRNALDALNLNDIQVDVNSTQIMMQEELALLRGATGMAAVPEAAPSPAPVPAKRAAPVPPGAANGVTSAADAAKLKKLEEENARLTKELKDAQNKAASAANDVRPPMPPDTAAQDNEIKQLKNELAALKTVQTTQAAVGGGEIKSLQTQISELTKQLTQKATTISERDSTIDSLNAQLKELGQKAADDKKEMVGKSDLDNAKKEIVSLNARIREIEQQAAANLKMRTDELIAKAETDRKAMEERMEAEKDEMMDAMAQEVDELEKTTAAEKAQLLAEKEALQKKLSILQQLTKSLSAGFNKLQSSGAALKKSHSAISKDVRRELNDFGASLKSYFTAGIVGKLQGVIDESTEINKKYRREITERKRLHNLVQELKGNIRVFTRCRPPTARENEQFGKRLVNLFIT